MAITALNIEQQIEDGIISLIEADTYISGNSVPVVGWFDAETIEGRQIIVHILKAIPSILDENGEAVEWEINIDLLQYIHNTEDETPGTETASIYQILMGFIEQTTKAQIQTTLTGLVVNGKNTSQSVEEYDERFYTKVASMTIYVE